jgi:hypothetical protein
MRLLVTNTLAPQTYAIVRALRPHAERIVALVEGEGFRAKLAPVCHSRLSTRHSRSITNGRMVIRTIGEHPGEEVSSRR